MSRRNASRSRRQSRSDSRSQAVPQRTHHCLRSLLDQVRSTPEHVRRTLMNRVAVTLRPPSLKEDSFHEVGFQPIEKVKVFVLRHQWGRDDDGRRVARSPLVVYQADRDGPLGRIRFKAVAAYETTLRGQDAHQARAISPVGNPSAARLAVQMHHALADAAESEVQAAPSLPPYWAAFRTTPGRDVPFRFEENPTTCTLAAAAGMTVEELFWAHKVELLQLHDGSLRVWDRDGLEAAARAAGSALFVPEGCEAFTAFPHHFLAREWSDDYAVHPVTDSPRPDCDAPEASWRDGWVVREGRWFPAAQTPDLVLVGPPALGRVVRNPAYDVLQSFGLLPALPLRDWVRRPRSREWPAEFAKLIIDQPPLVERLGAAVHLAGAALGVPTAARPLGELLVDLAARISVPEAAPIQVVRLQGLPSSATMTWPLAGIDCDLFSTGEWASAYEPAASAIPPSALEPGRKSRRPRRRRKAALPQSAPAPQEV